MKNDTFLCACAVLITLETQKCRKKAPRFVEFNFLRIALDENCFHRMTEEGQIYIKCCFKFFNFCLGLSYDLSKFSDDFTPFLR